MATGGRRSKRSITCKVMSLLFADRPKANRERCNRVCVEISHALLARARRAYLVFHFDIRPQLYFTLFNDNETGQYDIGNETYDTESTFVSELLFSICSTAVWFALDRNSIHLPLLRRFQQNHARPLAP